MKPALSLPAVCMALVILGGCSMGGASPTVANAAPGGEVPIVDSIPAGGKVISDINIELCQATAGDKPHTVDEAMRALKLVAKQKGASGVSNVTSGLVNVPTPKCFAMAQATGIAYVQG